jgi:hypothetical protein
MHDRCVHPSGWRNAGSLILATNLFLPHQVMSVFASRFNHYSFMNKHTHQTAPTQSVKAAGIRFGHKAIVNNNAQFTGREFRSDGLLAALIERPFKSRESNSAGLNDKVTIAGTPRNEEAGPVAQASVLPSVWSDCSWSFRIGTSPGFGKLNLLRTCSVSSWKEETMHGSLHKPRTGRSGTIKALVIYDDVALAAKACASLERAAHRAKVNARWNIKPWSVDILRFQSAGDEALAEAEDAELIVFAGPRADSLPPWLREWLGCWVTHRHAGEAALAVMRNGTREESSSLGAAELSRFAGLHGLGFIMEHDIARDGDAAGTVRALTQRNFPLSPTLEVAKPIRTHSFHLGWGIND